MAFFVPKPQDGYGNFGYLTTVAGETGGCVFEGVVETTSTGYQRIRGISAPGDLLSKWPTFALRYFAECEGPERFIPWEEMPALWEQLGLWPLTGLSETEKMLATVMTISLESLATNESAK